MKDRSYLILWAVCVVLIAANLYLLFQNRQLKKAFENAKQVVTEEGYRFSDIAYRGLDGKDETLNLVSGNRRTLLLVFRPSCQYCKQQYPYWKQLIQELDYESWQVLAVSSEGDLDKMNAHIEEQNIQNIKVGIVSSDEMKRSRMLFTPMTVAVDRTGEVQKVWTGLWTKPFDLPE